MTEEKKKELTEKFLKVYSNLPLSTREETIVVQEGASPEIKEPVSWQVVFFEVKNNTTKSEIFLELLNKMGLI